MHCVLDEHSCEYTKAFRLKKQEFKSFLSKRYGPVIVDRWQHLICFDIPIDFDSY